jgi:hypothetical protein
LLRATVMNHRRATVARDHHVTNADNGLVILFQSAGAALTPCPQLAGVLENDLGVILVMLIEHDAHFAVLALRESPARSK